MLPHAGFVNGNCSTGAPCSKKTTNWRRKWLILAGCRSAPHCGFTTTDTFIVCPDYILRKPLPEVARTGAFLAGRSPPRSVRNAAAVPRTGAADLRAGTPAMRCAGLGLSLALDTGKQRRVDIAAG